MEECYFLLEIAKDCLPQISLGPLLNALSHIALHLK